MEVGVTHIDIAQVFRNEKTVGKALEEFFKSHEGKADVDGEKGFRGPEQREKVWVATKLGTRPDGALGELKSFERFSPHSHCSGLQPGLFTRLL